MIKLRWYQTYNKNGLDNEPVLQFKTNEDDDFETVDYVREPEKLDDEH